MSPREQLIRRMMQRQQFARGGPGGFDPFEERAIGSGAFGLAGGPSLDQEVIPGLDYRDGPADMPFSPSPVGMADPIDMEELDAQFAAIQSGANPDMAGAEAGSLARQLDQEQTISGFGLDPEDNQGIYDMSDVLMGDTGDNALRPSLGPGTRGPGPDLPDMAPGGDMPLSVGMGNMNPRLTAATELAQKNWMDHHKPENYDSIEEYQQAAFSDGVVNPLYGNQTAEKIKNIYGVKTMPDQDNVAERALHAAATKKREINRDAFEKSLAYFGGSMEEYDKWHKGLPEDKRKAVYDWETALAALQGGEGQGQETLKPYEKYNAAIEAPDVVSDAGYYSGMDESGMFDSSFEFLTPTLQGPSMAEVQMGYPDISEEQAAGMITMPSPEDITMLPREDLGYHFDMVNAMQRPPVSGPTITGPTMPSPEDIYVGPNRVGMPSVEDIYVGPNRVGMPAMEDIQIGPRDEMMASMNPGEAALENFQQAEPTEVQRGRPRYSKGKQARKRAKHQEFLAKRADAEWEEASAMNDQMLAQQAAEAPTMSMNPEDMMSRYADPAVDAAPDGMFSQETAPLSQIQDQVMAAQSPDAGSISSTGEKKTRRRRRRESKGFRAHQRRKMDDTLARAHDREARELGLEFGAPPVDPSMQFGPYAEFGEPTVFPAGYDRSLGYVPLPQLSPELRRAQTRDRLREMRLQPTVPSPQGGQPPFDPGAIPTSDIRRQLLMRQLDRAGTGRY